MKPLLVVVEEDPLFREALSGVLMRNYDLVGAAGFSELAEALDSYEPDLFLLDGDRPGSDGFDLCRSIRSQARFRHVPVVVLTKLRDLDGLLRSLDANADACLTKPFHPEELLDTIRRLLSDPGYANG